VDKFQRVANDQLLLTHFQAKHDSRNVLKYMFYCHNKSYLFEAPCIRTATAWVRLLDRWGGGKREYKHKSKLLLLLP
jgi:hypothetical protein